MRRGKKYFSGGARCATIDTVIALKDTVLSILQHTDGFVSGQEICTQLGVSRTAVWKAIEKLRQDGYAIESAPNRGYRLAAVTQKFCASGIRAYLAEGSPLREKIIFLEQVDSTNNYLKACAASGAPDGTVAIADMQTGGRGRRGRSFCSPAGMGVYLSVLLRPNCTPDRLMHLTCAAAEATCTAIAKTAGFRPGIKWPNDLVYNGKKLTGILTELSIEAESGLVQYAVIGIGVNCLQTPADFPPEIRDMAGSLAMFSAQPIDRNALAAAMIVSLAEMSASLCAPRHLLMDAYRADCITVGKPVSLLRADTLRHGIATGVDDDGALLVKLENGETEAVNSGEVSVRGMYGYV